MNNVRPIVVHLPSTANQRTHQVFPLHIQRNGRYLVAVKNTGICHADLAIRIFPNYERVFEHTFMEDGFQGQGIERETKDEGKVPTSGVWSLPRGRFFVVVSAIVAVESKIGQEGASIKAGYEIGVATSPEFNMPVVPTVAGFIDNPRIPQESCVYIANHRYPPVKLEPGRTQYRLSKMKGTHELFGINVYQGVGGIDVKFEASRRNQSMFFLD